MSIRKRHWTTKDGMLKEAWNVDFIDATKRRRLKTFQTEAEAKKFEGLASAARSGLVPQPLTAKWHRPIEFSAPMPEGNWRNGSAREILAAALRSACPIVEPTHDAVILHVTAEQRPRSVIADVDNLIKPVLDVLTGVAWCDDTQICELLVRRIPGAKRCLHIKLWQIPRVSVAPHLNALMQVGLITDW